MTARTAPATTRTEMDHLLAGIVAEYATLATRPASDIAAFQRRENLHRHLNDLYWRRAELLVAERGAGDPEALSFSDDERLLIDMGVMDKRLLAPAGELADALAAERADAAPGVSYLSDWLAEHYRLRRTEREVTRAAARRREDGAYKTVLADARRKILQRLAPLFVGLPGVSRGVVEALTAGRLDEDILHTGLYLLDHRGKAQFHRRNRLKRLRDSVLDKARLRADETLLPLFDALDEVYLRDWRERIEARAQGGAAGRADDPGEEEAPEEENEAIAPAEWRKAEALVKLAADDGNTDIALLAPGLRATRPAVAKALRLAQAADREFVQLPAALIVPGRGRGTAAYEAETLVVALRPLANVEDSVAQALGRWRIELDARRDDSALMKEYRTRFGGDQSEAEFLADYRNWLCRVARGDVRTMPPERRAFFREFIGPDCSGPLVPGHFRQLSAPARAALAQRIERQIHAKPDDANLWRRVAGLHWLNGETDRAARRFKESLRLDPNDGETLLALGLLFRQQGDADGAEGLFRLGSERAAATLWGVYCRDALEGAL